ncbi:MAG TPA: transporter substrate-binding protein [Candidatus Peribacterales bacterium]|nr:transporter substrate-binding protein [Candidatus Peribacterales bacterium]
MIEDLLKDIGLSEKEAKLYITLLRHGQQTITFLSKRAEINRGLGYVLLHDLLEKGLVTKSSKGKVIYFSLLDPKLLVSYLENKKKDIDTKQERVQAMLGQFSAITNPGTAKPKIRFYDGSEGARTVLDSILATESKSLQAYVSVMETAKLVGGEHFRKFIEKLSSAEISLDVIRAREVTTETPRRSTAVVSLETSKKDHREIRSASQEFTFPMTMFIVDDKIAILSSSEENFALMIESREVASMQRKLFSMLWNSLERTTIRIGILHSLSGTMAISERPLVDAMLLAIDEINTRGGILGRRIDPIVVDGASDAETFRKQAEALITKQDVCSIFGGWTSDSRKTMKPVFEKYDHILWYPMQYEGLEESSNIFYMGAAPNQQMIPAVDWAVKHLGKKLYLVGSDYVYPRSANEIMRGRIKELGGTVVGEHYEKLGGSAFTSIVKNIRATNPDVILNTINGDSNVDFFRALRKAGISPKQIPTISFSISEEEISRMHPETMVGDFAAWSYFQSIPSKENERFVTNFRNKHGRYRVTGDPIETAYFSIHMFAAAVKKAGSDDVTAIREAALGLTFMAPEGPIRIDADTRHTHRIARIGQLQSDGQFKVIWSSETPIKPDPYPQYKSRKEWDTFLKTLYKKWGGHWAMQ